MHSNDVNRSKLRAGYKELTFLKQEDPLAKGKLSDMIRNAARLMEIDDTGLLEYAKENIGKGSLDSEIDRDVFKQIKDLLTQKYRATMNGQDDIEWLKWFEAR